MDKEKENIKQGETQGYVPRLQKEYQETIVPALMQEHDYKNIYQVPKLEKVVLNMGIGEAVADAKRIQGALEDLQAIAGQRPVITKAKKSIATFKLRKGMPIGVQVTLRKTRMYEFVDRLVTMALPRVRDFRGLSPKSFDGHGNYSFGIQEHIIFYEVNYDKILQIFGMDIAVVTSARTDKEAESLLRKLRFPLR